MDISNREDVNLISKNQDVICPICHEKQFSPFDRIYVTVYEKCVTCTFDDDELKKNAQVIFDME